MSYLVSWSVLELVSQQLDSSIHQCFCSAIRSGWILNEYWARRCEAAPQMTMNLSSVSQLLEDMENWDKDKRFMAASDLTQEVTMSNQVLDVHLQKRVCQAFDQSIDVQGNAVKCLAKIVCKFQEQQIGEVLAKLSQQVLDGKAEVRDIYATCLKGLLTELPATCSALACQNVLPKMLHGITSIPSLEVRIFISGRVTHLQLNETPR
eukprot:symbB.v1.2.029463.t1/scaffold3222.1/size60838/5